MSYFIFGVRAYTVNGYGEWTVIANETLKLPLQLSSNCATSDSVIALSVLVGILCGLLTVSVVVHIYCFIRKKSLYTYNKQTKAYDDIAMQVCEPYEIHKTKQSEENEGVYDECQTSPDDSNLSSQWTPWDPTIPSCMIIKVFLFQNGTNNIVLDFAESIKFSREFLNVITCPLFMIITGVCLLALPVCIIQVPTTNGLTLMTTSSNISHYQYLQMAMSVSLVILLFLFTVNKVISQCPPSSGIYLQYDGHCYSNGSYFWDSNIRWTLLECGLPGATLNGGQWIGPNGVVPCDGGNNSNVQCTTESGTSLSVFINPVNGYLEAPGDGWYKCCLPTDCSDPSTNIIFANIFSFAQIESFTVADLPSDMTVYPQEYKLNCIKIGHVRYAISMSIGSTALANYTGCYDYGNPCPGTVLVSGTNIVRYTVDITWDGMTVSSESISQSITGNQMYQCVVDNQSGADRTRNLSIKVPATAPTSLTEVSKTATTITVSWTALYSSDADGYVVNVTSDTDTVQTVQVEGSSNNTITLNGLRGDTTYSITVRAYQQLLGPASSTISVQALPVINSINWTLVSSITQLNNTQYRIDCLTTTDINPSTDVYWLVNEVMKSNSMYTSIDVLTYNNTLLVYPDPLGVSVNVTCIAMIGGVNYSQFVILHAPIGPPNNVRGFILNATSIKVNWTNSSETNGYVIEYTTGGVTRNVVSTSEDDIVLAYLSPLSAYIISVYSYIDLPSVNSTVTVLRFDVPSPVTSLSVSNVSTTGITVNWTIPSSDNYVTYYTISYTPSCPQLSSVNETVSVAPHQSPTIYSYTLIGLYS
uniref:Fibronectin type-III domain-containing protein n=1 Tax=Amphimedon queenslandica TaxID=400682 RepID=A0A1X7SZY3_AMPQE